MRGVGFTLLTIMLAGVSLRAQTAGAFIAVPAWISPEIGRRSCTRISPSAAPVRLWWITPGSPSPMARGSGP